MLVYFGDAEDLIVPEPLFPRSILDFWEKDHNPTTNLYEQIKAASVAEQYEFDTSQRIRFYNSPTNIQPDCAMGFGIDP